MGDLNTGVLRKAANWTADEFHGAEGETAAMLAYQAADTIDALRQRVAELEGDQSEWRAIGKRAEADAVKAAVELNRERQRSEERRVMLVEVDEVLSKTTTWDPTTHTGSRILALLERVRDLTQTEDEG